MVTPIALRGRTPYRLEYSQKLFKKRDGSYKSPYGVIYSSPYENCDIPEITNNYKDKPYKVGRLLSEYDFYTNFKDQSPKARKLSMDF